MGERFNPFNREKKEQESEFPFSFRTVQLLGPREAQQDYFASKVFLKDGKKVQINAVADGHGELGEVFAENAIKSILTGIENYPGDIGDEGFKQIFNTADEMTKEIPGNEEIRRADFGGTTMSVVVLKNNEVKGAYVGDSEVKLVGSHGIITSLTPPHRITDAEELMRIVSGRGQVERDRVKVKGVSLNMSRAIGDHEFKPHVISEPHTFGLRIQSSDKYLLVASDGFWNVENGEDEADLGELLTAAESIDEAKDLLELYLAARRQGDNITVQIIELNNKKSG
ncbi:MAG: PP2C family protein-serine/threonine phosphatase [Patescibacteria group bacterium]|jgi:serine/threonine protein phosphatase PrpC